MDTSRQWEYPLLPSAIPLCRYSMVYCTSVWSRSGLNRDIHQPVDQQYADPYCFSSVR